DDLEPRQGREGPPAQVFKLAIAGQRTRRQGSVGQEEARVVAAAGNGGGDGPADEIQGRESRRDVLAGERLPAAAWRRGGGVATGFGQEQASLLERLAEGGAGKSGRGTAAAAAAELVEHRRMHRLGEAGGQGVARVHTAAREDVDVGQE